MLLLRVDRAHFLSASNGVAMRRVPLLEKQVVGDCTLRYVPVRATVRLREAETARQLEHLEQEPISSGIFLKDLKSEE